MRDGNNMHRLIESITDTIKREVIESGTVTRYREPLVGFVAADAPGFAQLRCMVDPTHMSPHDLLPGARSVVSFFVPFAPDVVHANAQRRDEVAREWALAYVETNSLIGRIAAAVTETLAQRGIRAAAEPATHNFDTVKLVSRWSHKSVAVLAGLGSFGLHHLVITDAGCAGRFGSLVIDAELPRFAPTPRERCLYFHDGSCVECVIHCPVGALDEANAIDKQRCWTRCLETAARFTDLGQADVCGKCSYGPCALESAV